MNLQKRKYRSKQSNMSFDLELYLRDKDFDNTKQPNEEATQVAVTNNSPSKTSHKRKAKIGPG